MGISSSNNPPFSVRLGDFEITRELGRGGMGIVYEARQVSLNRKVALKVLSGGLGLTTQAITRFRREAAAAAKLHHTNIVPIYATAAEDGSHFYAMELIDGPSLDKVIRQMRNGPKMAALSPRSESPETTGTDLDKTVAESAPIPGRSSAVGDTTSTLAEGNTYFDTVARMIAEVADALDYAHKLGVIHRDIKPSNLLLSPQGRLSISDFGLARMLEEPGMTMTGEFVGSPLYMSPEQITAGRMRLDHRTDIYSLGATLYQLLTFQPPFPGESRDQIIGQIISKDPKPLRAINRKIPADLETICLKAIEKDPDRRYQTAGNMAEDLRRFVNRFAITARRAGFGQRALKWTKRHPALAGSLVALFLVGLAAVGLLYRVQVAEQQLAVEKQRQAIDEGLTAAMSGDLEATEEAIKKAEVLRAEPSELRFLRGLVTFQLGEYLTALDQLEQAVALNPRHLAAWSLMARASDFGGAWAKGRSISQAMEKLTPITPEELLFKALAEPIWSDQGLALADQAVAKRPGWAIGYAVRSTIQARRAIDVSNFALAEKACEDARLAEALSPRSSFAIQQSLVTFLISAVHADKMGEQEKRRQFMSEARTRFERMKGDSTAGAAIWRSLYLRLNGPLDAYHEELRAGLERFPFFRERMCWELYSNGKVQEAWELIPRIPHGQNLRIDWVRFCILAELTDDGPSKALALYQEMARQNDLSVSPEILWLLGHDAEATKAFQRRRTDRPPVRPQTSFEKTFADFTCDSVSEEDLVRSASGSQLQLLMAHYFIGMRRLGRGERAGAKEYFAKAADTGLFYYFYAGTSKSFLARMEADPAWPPWIPMKEPVSPGND